MTKVDYSPTFSVTRDNTILIQWNTTETLLHLFRAFSLSAAIWMNEWMIVMCDNVALNHHITPAFKNNIKFSP